MIKEKNKQNIDTRKLESLAKEIEKTYKKVESEVGVKVDDLKMMWTRILKARTLMSAAKNELITRNLRLVVNIAKKYVELVNNQIILSEKDTKLKSFDEFKNER